MPRDRTELIRRFPGVKGLELDPLDVTAPAELGDERQQRMPSVELVRAIGEHEHHARVAQVSYQEPEQVAG